jgi:hypothetical protein
VNVLRLAPGGDGSAADRFDVYAMTWRTSPSGSSAVAARSEEPSPDEPGAMSPAQ